MNTHVDRDVQECCQFSASEFARSANFSETVAHASRWEADKGRVFESQIQKIKTINLIIPSIEKVLIFSFIVVEITQKLYLESEKRVSS